MIMKMNKIDLKIYLELSKVGISLFSTLSAATGFILAAHDLREEMFVMMIGVFLLACGSCALNQYQERDIDALMERTKNRPIPSKRIEPLNALYFALILTSVGLFSLVLSGSLIVPTLGVFAILLYNGVYIYLKRKTAFALIPGALIGSIPPAIGWVTGRGYLSGPELSALCFFFFMWQVPHFWLLLLDYGKDYEKAGLPSLSRIFSREQLSRIVFNWIVATAVSSLFISVSGMISTSVINFSLLGVSLWLIWNGIRLFRKKEGLYRFAFNRINIYLFFIMLLLSLDKLFSPVFLRFLSD